MPRNIQTYPDFTESNVTTNGTKVFHPIQSQLAEVSRIFASAGDERQRYIPDILFSVAFGRCSVREQTSARGTLESTAEQGPICVLRRLLGHWAYSFCIFRFAKVRKD